MLFGRRDKDKKKPNDRVLDLKARVDALRQADEASRGGSSYTLDHFLEGDDVLTGRSLEDDYKPTGFDASASSEGPPAEDHFEVNLQAELEKFIKREEERALNEQRAASEPAPPFVFDSDARETPSPAFGSTWGQEPSAPPSPPRTEPSDIGSVWPGEETNWSAPSEPARGLAVFPMEEEPAETLWPNARDWPSEEAWPTGEDEKAV